MHFVRNPGRVPNVSPDQRTICICADGSAGTNGARLSGRAGSRPGLVREVPPAQWATGAEEARARLESSADGRRPATSRSAWPTRSCVQFWTMARRGVLPGQVRTGATFAVAAVEYLRYIEHDRGREPSTLRGYRSALQAHLLPAFGSMAVEDVTTEAIERWIAGFSQSVRTRNKLLIELHGPPGSRQEGVRVASKRCRRDREVPAADGAARSRCSRRRRCGLWCARPPLSRTGRCT